MSPFTLTLLLAVGVAGIEGAVEIQSKNFPDHYFGLGDKFEFRIDKTAYPLRIVSPGLTGERGTVSFQSMTDRSKYIRHFNFVLYLEDKNSGRDAAIFAKDATFRIRKAEFFKGFVSFESVNFPGRFVRHQGNTLKLHPDDGSDLMHNDASFKIVERPVQIQSKNFPDHYFGSEKNFEFRISKVAYPVRIVSPGLTGEKGTVSFQSASEPNKYIRHFGFVLYLEDKNSARNPEAFPKDATFKIRTNKFFKRFVSFESVNFPGRFIRHEDSTLKLHPDDGSELMHNDASFKVIET